MQAELEKAQAQIEELRNLEIGMWERAETENSNAKDPSLPTVSYMKSQRTYM